MAFSVIWSNTLIRKSLYYHLLLYVLINNWKSEYYFISHEGNLIFVICFFFFALQENIFYRYSLSTWMVQLFYLQSNFIHMLLILLIHLSIQDVPFDLIKINFTKEASIGRTVDIRFGLGLINRGSGGDITTLNTLMNFMNWSRSSWYIYTKGVSHLKIEKCYKFKNLCKVQVSHATLCFIRYSLSRHQP